MNPRQLTAPLALLAVGILFGLAGKLVPTGYEAYPFFIYGLIAAGIVITRSGGSEQGPSLAPLVEALQAAARGKRPRLPEGATGELLDAYTEIERVAKKSAELTEQVEQLEQHAGGSHVDWTALSDAIERASKGERVRAPSGVDPEAA